MKRLLLNQSGQDLVEYALIVAAVGLALVVSVNELTQTIANVYSGLMQPVAAIGAAS